MLKRSLIFSLAAAASFVVISLVLWFVLDADLHLKKANATTLTALSSRAVAPEPFKMAHAANPTTTRLLALDREQHLAFWTVALKNKKQVCDVVVRTMYQGGTESGVDNWSIGCQDGSKYSISINPDAQELQSALETLSPQVLNSAWSMRSVSARGDLASTCQRPAGTGDGVLSKAAVDSPCD